MGVGNRPSRDRRTEQRENRLPALRQPPSCRGGSPYADRLTRPVCQMESGDPDACERYPEPTSSAQSAATWPPPPKTASTSPTPSPNSPRDTRRRFECAPRIWGRRRRDARRQRHNQRSRAEYWCPRQRPEAQSLGQLFGGVDVDHRQAWRRTGGERLGGERSGDRVAQFGRGGQAFRDRGQTARVQAGADRVAALEPVVPAPAFDEASPQHGRDRTLPGPVSERLTFEE